MEHSFDGKQRDCTHTYAYLPLFRACAEKQPRIDFPNTWYPFPNNRLSFVLLLFGWGARRGRAGRAAKGSRRHFCSHHAEAEEVRHIHRSQHPSRRLEAVPVDPLRKTLRAEKVVEKTNVMHI